MGLEFRREEEDLGVTDMQLAVNAMETHEITLQRYVVMEEKENGPKIERENTNAIKKKRKKRES